jgi:hypothetical protein
MRTQVQEGRRRTPITSADRIMASTLEPSSVPTRSFSKIIAVERPKGLSRVRVGRVKEHKGMVQNQPMEVVTTQYLDGHGHWIAQTKDFYQEDEMTFDAVPVRTRDITDFGRLSMAAKSLASSMSAFSKTEPSPEQVAVFINGYRNLMEWRRKAREQMTRAEGEIDVVEILLTKML